MDTAVAQATFALFFNHGQCCCAGSRVYVHEKIYDEFVQKAKATAEARKVGDPFTEVDQGPQVDQLQFDRVMGFINRAKDSGIPLVTGGARAHDTGFYIQPTIFSDVPEDVEMWTDEIFGPVMGISKFSDEDDVVRRANNSEFGLAAGVFSNDANTLMRMQRRLRAGTVWLNCYNVFDNATPFGGYKNSGVGREKGEIALNNYLQTKTVIQPIVGDSHWYR